MEELYMFAKIMEALESSIPRYINTNWNYEVWKSFKNKKHGKKNMFIHFVTY